MAELPSGGGSAGGGRARHRHSLMWRVSKAIEQVGVANPLVKRTGPAWAFGLLGVMAELVLAPVVLALTFVVGIGSYMVLDAPWTRVRSQQRPRFVSVRILYLNTLIVAGFWLAVMFTFSAADPSVSNGIDQRLPALLDVTSAQDLATFVSKQRTVSSQARDPLQSASTWFDVFLHGLLSAVAVNFLLYAVVVTRRRQRSHSARREPRKTPYYDSMVGLFVDDDSHAPR